jgi:hypothetical protein
VASLHGILSIEPALGPDSTEADSSHKVCAGGGIVGQEGATL